MELAVAIALITGAAIAGAYVYLLRRLRQRPDTPDPQELRTDEFGSTLDDPDADRPTGHEGPRRKDG